MGAALFTHTSKGMSMATVGKSVLTALGIGALMVGLAGCEEKKEGPAERAGKEIDKTMEKAG
jgi:hypothetical protein